MIVTASATVFHLARGEFISAGITFVLLAMAAVVASGRAVLVPIRSRHGVAA